MRYGVPLFILSIFVACSTNQNQRVISQTNPMRHPPPVAEEMLLSEVRACPNDMVEIKGNYYPVVAQRCLYMVDIKGQKTNEAPDPYTGRCGEFANPVEPVSIYVHKHYCIDKYEFPNKEGGIPQDWMTWYDAKNACQSVGKRLCTRSEWTFAAEGPNRHPIPYGDGFHRDKTLCNFDNFFSQIDPKYGKITGDEILKVSKPDSLVAQGLHSLLVSSGSKPQCVSDWGVHDMSGNIDEWVVNESGHPYVSGLMGGHVFGVRNASRPMTDAHGPDFGWYETGTRCCADAAPKCCHDVDRPVPGSCMPCRDSE